MKTVEAEALILIFKKVFHKHLIITIKTFFHFVIKILAHIYKGESKY